MEEADKNLNEVCSSEYSPQTARVMSEIRENDVPFDIIPALLDYIKNLNVPGAVLVFLPGWSQIFALLRQLQQHPVYGGQGFRIIPLHSQLPREDQRAVFEVGIRAESLSCPLIGQLSPINPEHSLVY